MAIPMHAKSDSEVTSLDPSSPPRSPRRPLYFVQSPSQHDAEKMSYGSSPVGSPHHHHYGYHYHCSPIHHSRESSTSRFSDSLKHGARHLHGGGAAGWKKMRRVADVDEDDGDDDGDGGEGGGGGRSLRLYLCVGLGFVILFTVFSLILWGAARAYKPKILIKNMVFHSFNVQAGMDPSGVPTDMMSLNSTVKISYRNPATFFGVHVTSTPVELHYYQLLLASGRMKQFYQSRKSERNVVMVVRGYQVPLYGGVSVVGGPKGRYDNVVVPLNLTFVMRSRAYILGRLVKTKFYEHIRCGISLRGNRLGKPLNVANSCIYHR